VANAAISRRPAHATTAPRARATVGCVHPAWTFVATIATADRRAILAIAIFAFVFP
jgi:hypothetical protein